MFSNVRLAKVNFDLLWRVFCALVGHGAVDIRPLDQFSICDHVLCPEGCIKYRGFDTSTEAAG